MTEVEKLARAMAIVDGFDPDALVNRVDNEPVRGEHDFDVAGLVLKDYRVPAWYMYEKRAELTLAVYDTIKD